MRARLVALAVIAVGATAASAWYAVSRSATSVSRPVPAASAATALPSGFQSYMTDTADPVTAGFGYTLADVTAIELGGLTKQKGLVWVGNWTRTSCTWAVSDATLTALIATDVRPNKAHLYGFYIADEPDGSACPGATAALRARTALIHTLLPGYPTYAVIEFPSHYASFNGSVDIMGIDPYPCHRGAACSTTEIPADVAALKSAGVRRYWGVIQAFQDAYYRFPTTAELVAMIAQWKVSGWSGQQTFAWRYAGNALSDHPGLLAVLGRLNSGR
jgi:hypothetical protein